MRILVFSDLHLHSFREFATYEEGQNSRLIEIADRLNEVFGLAQDEEVDVVVFAGDFFDNKNHIEVNALTQARTLISSFAEQDLGIPIIMCSGTHDIGRNQCSTLISLEGSHPELYIDSPCVVSKHIIVPVSSPVGNENHCDKIGDVISGLKNHDLEDEGILVTHGFVTGPHFQTPGGMGGGLPEEYLLGRFKLSIVGHYHNPNRNFYQTGRKAILVPGSVIPHNFGNPEPGKAWVVDVNADEDIQFDCHTWKHPRFVTVDLSIDRNHVFHKDDYHRAFVPPGMETKFPPEANIITVQREEIKARTRVENLSVGDTPKDLVEKYVLYKTGEEGLPVSPPKLSLIGKIIVESKDKELSDKDTEKIEGVGGL